MGSGVWLGISHRGSWSRTSGLPSDALPSPQNRETPSCFCQRRQLLNTQEQPVLPALLAYTSWSQTSPVPRHRPLRPVTSGNLKGAPLLCHLSLHITTHLTQNAYWRFLPLTIQYLLLLRGWVEGWEKSVKMWAFLCARPCYSKNSKTEIQHDTLCLKWLAFYINRWN